MRWIAGFFASLLFIILGYALIYMHAKDKSLNEALLGKQLIWVAELVESPSKTEKSVKSLAKLQYIQLEDSLHTIDDSKFLIYLKQDSQSLELKVGDVLIGRSYFQKIPAAKNPAQFDYSEFLANRDVYMQTYLAKDWQKIGQSNSLLRLAEHWRQFFLEIFKKAGLRADNYTVAAALTLGYKNDLNPNLRERFSGSGAMHILAVSGLHIGIVYLIFNWLVQFLGKAKYMRILKSALLLLALWSYAILTGLSPSVQRAACMFSFIVLADAVGRHNNIFNSIAASAIFLLILQANLLFEVGFQLSYAAIMGIILIHPKIYPFLEFKSVFLDKVWSLMVVSLAAQMATFVFSIYYFHQFPSIFLLTNLLVIPLAFFILITAILLLLLYLLFNTTFLLGTLFDYLLSFLNFIVDLFYNLPYSHVDGIYISVLSAFLLFLAIIAFIFYLYYYRVVYLMMFLSPILILCIFELMENKEQSEQKLFTIYALRKQFAMSVVEGKKAVVIADLNSTDKSAGIVLEHLKSIGIKKQDWLLMDRSKEWENELMYFYRTEKAIYLTANGKEMIIPLKNFPSNLKLEFDYILIAKNLKDMPCLQGKTIVPESSFNFYERKKILKELEKCDNSIIASTYSISL